MKKLISCIIVAVLSSGILSACAAEGEEVNDVGKLRIVTTIFPGYDWVMNILGEEAGRFDVKLLPDNGVDLHSYQASAEDIHDIVGCDLFIYVGGESEDWVGDALKEAVNKDMISINLLEILGEGARKEEPAEADADEGWTGEYDEHVWLSLKNAKTFVTAISDSIVSLDLDRENEYQKNTLDYIEKLDALDRDYQTTIDGAQKNVLLFADRFPFIYMVNDYGLSYYAAFSGCSAETEASFETVTFLAGKLDELDLTSVLIIDGSDDRLAKTVISNTAMKDQDILVLDSMQSMSAKEIEEGRDYLGIMTEDLSVLERALR